MWERVISMLRNLYASISRTHMDVLLILLILELKVEHFWNFFSGLRTQVHCNREAHSICLCTYDEVLEMAASTIEMIEI